MKRLEIILGIIIIISLILKFNLISGGSTLFVVSILTLSVIYYPLGFAFFNEIRLRQIFNKNSYKGLTALRIIGAIGAGIVLSTICIGILFKLQYWVGEELYLKIGLFFSLIILIISLVKYIKAKNVYYKGILIRTLIIGSIGLILLLLPNMTIRKIQYRNHPEYIKAYQNYIRNPNDLELQKKLELEHNRATMSKERFEMYQLYQEK